MNHTSTSSKITSFLRESNAIEGEYSDVMLQQAQYAWDYLIGERKMTTSVVLKTHKTLMLKSNLLPNERGYFRFRPVWIGGEEATSHLLIRDLLDVWCGLMNEKYKKVDEDLSKHLHVMYEKIHPFIDGNGRTGRMFMNWFRLRNHMDLRLQIMTKVQRLMTKVANIRSQHQPNQCQHLQSQSRHQQLSSLRLL